MPFSLLLKLLPAAGRVRIVWQTKMFDHNGIEEREILVLIVDDQTGQALFTGKLVAPAQ